MFHGFEQRLVPMSQSLMHFLEQYLFDLVSDVKAAVLDVEVHLVHEVFLANGVVFLSCDHFKYFVYFVQL
jgi:hypothetical protein